MGWYFIYMLLQMLCETPVSVKAAAACCCVVQQKTGHMTLFVCLKPLHAFITGLPSIKWKIHHSTSTDLAHK